MSHCVRSDCRSGAAPLVDLRRTQSQWSSVSVTVGSGQSLGPTLCGGADCQSKFKCRALSRPRPPSALPIGVMDLALQVSVVDLSRAVSVGTSGTWPHQVVWWICPNQLVHLGGVPLETPAAKELELKKSKTCSVLSASGVASLWKSMGVVAPSPLQRQNTLA